MTSTQLIEGDAAFDQLAAEWDTLAAGGMTNTPFQSHAYQQAWWRNLHPENGRLFTIAVRDTNNQLSAIACLYLNHDALHFNGCIEETDYLDLIASAEAAEAGWTAVFETITRTDFPEWQAMKLCNIPAASPSRAILAALAKKHGLAWKETVAEVCPVISLPPSFDEYLESLDSKQRRETKRKLRRAQGGDAQFVQADAQNLPQAVDDFLALLQKSTFEKRDWLNEGRRAIFHETAQAAAQAGTLQLLFMEVNGRKAATLFNFDYNNRIWVYNSGLDPEAFGQLSLGVVLTAKAIEWAIENGRSEFDFLRGSEPYKYQFGAKDTEIYQITLQK